MYLYFLFYMFYIKMNMVINSLSVNNFFIYFLFNLFAFQFIVYVISYARGSICYRNSKIFLQRKMPEIYINMIRREISEGIYYHTFALWCGDFRVECSHRAYVRADLFAEYIDYTSFKSNLILGSTLT